MKRKRPEAGSFTIGWISALPVEHAAGEALLNEEYDNHGDMVQYTLGRIHDHNVVMACLPAGQIGTTAAATVATEMRLQFPSLRSYLLVGIGGGVPSSDADIRLGDVVVSEPQGKYGGVVQYDLGKTITGGAQIRTGIMSLPSSELLTAVAKLQSCRSAEKSHFSDYLAEVAHRSEYNRDLTGPDQLFDASYDHTGETCAECDPTKVLFRIQRTSCEPHIHFGTIASGNQVIKDGRTRDRLSAELKGILCFEMEAAGMMNQLRCLVIRGICDYADSHKNKTWQPFAAATAAACAKEILSFLPSINSASLNQLTTAAPWLSYMKSLRFDQMDARRTTIRNAHVKTCRWLLNRQEYQDWLNRHLFSQHRGFLWIKGKPATGKSTIMRFIYEQTVTKLKDTVIVAFFFNARGEEMERSVLGMYQSLLYQLLDKLPDLQEVFDSLKLMHPTDVDFHQWDVETLQSLFKTAVENLAQRPLICFIDALDECEEDQVRDMISFFEQLGEIASQHKCYLHVCFSSRHYPHISIASGIELVLENQEGHEHDILNYIESELRIGKTELAKQIKSEVLNRASGIFLWAVLVVQMLNKLADRGQVHRLRKQLSEIPNGLHDLLRDILTRGERNTANMVLCLQWILYARRPLRCEELYFAILSGDENSTESFAELNRIVSKDDMKRFILDSSKGLAEETRSKKPTIQFIHESVREFLLKENILDKIEADPQNTFAALSHDTLKHCCIVYMGINISAYLGLTDTLPKAGSNEAKHLRELATKEFPFLEYSVQHVLHHSNASEEHGLSQAAFLQRFPLGRWILLNNLFEKYEIRRYTPHASQLYIFADKNLASLIRLALKNGPPMEPGAERYRDPLLAAIGRRNEAAVKALLPLDTDPNTESASGQPPHEVVPLSTSLEYQFSINCMLSIGEKIASRNNFNIFLWAAANGYTEVVKLLVKKGAIIESKDSSERTALSLAAERGRIKIVKLLMNNGADIESKDYIEQTPLFLAATSGHTETVKLLVENGADIESKDHIARTPLYSAVSRGHTKTVKLLLEKGANVGSKAFGPFTPFYEHTEIVRLLMENGAHIGSEDLRALLSSAVVAGGIISDNLLRENGAKYRPLFVTTGVMELLREEIADTESLDPKQITSLCSVIVQKHTEVTKQLLENVANVESMDSNQMESLCSAINKRHAEAIKLILENGTYTSVNRHPIPVHHPNLLTDAGDVVTTSVTPQQTMLDPTTDVAEQQTACQLAVV
ncbi:hypothetical protein Plec18167_001104 [Paecilomyces lecythidis]|uniref:Nucleoside phosphorylase domain-containing protein n=1 Tax=Paecilomyces lecythidis TaxID=3004212 RepID=A0ABR3YBD6_9EURO